MNPIEITLNRLGDNSTHSSADIRCKRTPHSVQGEHLKTSVFGILKGSPLQVRLRVTKNLLAIILIPITLRIEEFANHFLILKTFRTLDERENQSLDDLFDYMDNNLGKFNEVSHINILLILLLLIYMTFELNIKCLWQHPANSNHLEITKIEHSETTDTIVITAHSLRQLQPKNLETPIKLRTIELTNLLSAQQGFTKFLHFKNTHPLTRHLVKELIRLCQSSVSGDQATSPKRNETNYN